MFHCICRIFLICSSIDGHSALPPLLLQGLGMAPVLLMAVRESARPHLALPPSPDVLSGSSQEPGFG